MLEAISFDEIITCFLVLFAIIDIIGSIPIFVSLRKKFGKIDCGNGDYALFLVFRR